MRQLFQNLLSNALKYHRPDTPPQITVRGHIEDGWAEISVQDNGIGFDMAYVGRIFQPFQRLHGRSQYEGSGIGLAICRRIIERHHGEISAQSVPGEGATFTVRIPLSQETSV
jgi:signal transduction histidine kinase